LICSIVCASAGSIVVVVSSTAGSPATAASVAGAAGSETGATSSALVLSISGEVELEPEQAATPIAAAMATVTIGLRTEFSPEH